MKDVKLKFDTKFKQNEQTWKKRLDYHKDIILRESEKAEHYL